ncbi:hypothetical protein Tco_0817515 [Tanacetum coccineum]
MERVRGSIIIGGDKVVTWCASWLGGDKEVMEVLSKDQDSIDVVLLSSSDQVMHFEVKLLHDKRSFFVSFIYGENESRDRLKLWDNLSEHMGLVNSRPWTMLGDLMFLPYVTSDHCPTLLVITDVTKKKIRAFRFMNYLTEKKEFHKLVNDKWNEPIKGYAMFVLAKRLKNIKRHLRDLNKKNGNVHEKVKMLTTELKKVHVELDEDPNNPTLR